jgi:hypothetical protein
MRLSRKGPPPPTGYVGDHADKLHRIRRLPHDDDERPSREDRDYGHTLFTRALRPMPRFLRSRKNR